MSVDIIELLCAVLLLGGGLALLFKRLGLPVIPGYILGGFLLSPYWPYVPVSFTPDSPQVRTLSNLGVLLLLFTVGLEFGFKRIRSLGVRPFAVGTAECACAGMVAYVVAIAIGLRGTPALFAAAVFAFSSTTVILKTLDDLRLRGERFAEPLMGVLIVEDLLAIVTLVALSTLAGMGGEHAPAGIGAVGMALVVALLGWWLVGSILAPRLTHAAQRYGGVELLVILCVGLCLGMGIVFERIGLSGALGAFVTGAILADTRQIRLVRRNVAPLRDVFAAIFFVSFGLRLDPSLVWENAVPISAFYLVLVGGKVLFTWAFGTLAGLPARDSAKMGFLLTQIGEFSLVIVDLGARAGVVDARLAATATGVAILSIFTTSAFARNDERMIAGLARRIPVGLRAEASRYVARLDVLSARRLPSRAGARAASRFGVFLSAASGAVRNVFLTATHGSTSTSLERLAPWEEYLVEVEVEDDAPAEHASLEGLALKDRFAAIVVAVERDGRVSVPPEPGYRFSSGDVVLLYGDERHIAAAMEEFRARPRASDSDRAVNAGDDALVLQDVSLRRIEVSAAHPFAGKTLRELALRSTARALVLAVAREGTRLKTLPPDFRLEPGDEVFVVGPKGRIAAL